MSSQTSNVQLSNGLYDQVKRSATVLLPGFSALYFALAQIWGLPAAEQVVGTVAAVNVFLGLLMSLSTKAYNSNGLNLDGDLHVITEDDGKAYTGVALNDIPEVVRDQKTVTLRVVDQTDRK